MSTPPPHAECLSSCSSSWAPADDPDGLHLTATLFPVLNFAHYEARHVNVNVLTLCPSSPPAPVGPIGPGSPWSIPNK